MRLLLLLVAFAAVVHGQNAMTGKMPMLKNATTGKMTTNGMAMDDHAGHDHAGHDHGAGGHGGGMAMAGGNMTMPTKALPVPDSCVTAPTQGNCSNFDYPHANAVNDLNRLCGAMSFMTACSVSSACSKADAGGDGSPTGPGSTQVSSNNKDICRALNQVATVCRLDTGMSRMAGCDNFRSMCVDGSPVPKCKLSGITSIPTTTAVNTQVRAICEANPKMEGCAACTPAWTAGKKWANCDLLATYSKLCSKDASMPQCVEWHTMCKADSSLIFCTGYDDKAKKAADSVLKNKPADPESKQSATPAKSAAGSRGSSYVLLVALAGAAAAVLAL